MKQMKRELLLILCVFLCVTVKGQQIDSVPLIDLHIHLKGDLTIEDAILKSKHDGVQYGIAANCGLGFPIQNDAQIDSFINVLREYPQFYLGMQAEGREWIKLFSKESIEKFDYVFTDAMTFTDDKGRRNRIWIEEETWVENEEDFMDYYVKIIVEILNNEPIDIYVNPTYLPGQMVDKYDYFWNEERTAKVISAAKNNDVAIEINNRFKIPSAEFIKKAKQAGVKFTIGTNNIDKNFSGPEYALEIIRKCRLTRNDFFIPDRKE